MKTLNGLEDFQIRIQIDEKLQIKSREDFSTPEGYADYLKNKLIETINNSKIRNNFCVMEQGRDQIILISLEKKEAE